MLPVRALIFDFDGLLVDTESAALLAWEETLASTGIAVPRELWLAAIGGQGLDLAMLEYVGGRLGADRAAALREAWWARHLALVHAAPPRPGVLGYLAEAVRLGLGLAVASSAKDEWVGGHLRRLGWHETFTVVATGDRHAAKPAPDTYLGALAGLGVPAAQAVAFEDSPAGVAAAKAAGLRCVAVPNPVTAGLAFPGADLVLSSMDSTPLPDLLAGFGAPDRPVGKHPANLVDRSLP
jgi:HAD superfamily hydrolase (TIGR01509 family)